MSVLFSSTRNTVMLKLSVSLTSRFGHTLRIWNYTILMPTNILLPSLATFWTIIWDAAIGISLFESCPILATVYHLRSWPQLWYTTKSSRFRKEQVGGMPK